MAEPDITIRSLVREAISAVEQTAEIARKKRDARGLPIRSEAADAECGEDAADLFHYQAGAEAARAIAPEDFAPAVKLWGHADNRQWKALAQIAGKLGWNVEADELRRWWKASS